MNILQLAILLFIVLEGLNVIILYFYPGTRLGNAVGVFNGYEASKKDAEVHALINYLINWVAGVKLIFIALLIVILTTAAENTQLLAVVAIIASTLSFYWRLYPAIKQLDGKGQLTPVGYSKTLNYMIAGILLVFTAALVLYLLVNP